MLLDLLHVKDRIRNVAIVGHLHHGKTSLMDVLVEETHKVSFSPENQARLAFFHLELKFKTILIVGKVHGPAST
jgi:U5 small nuclear ribonucleoprotein component